MSKRLDPVETEHDIAELPDAAHDVLGHVISEMYMTVENMTSPTVGDFAEDVRRRMGNVLGYDENGDMTWASRS